MYDVRYRSRIRERNEIRERCLSHPSAGWRSPPPIRRVSVEKVRGAGDSRGPMSRDGEGRAKTSNLQAAVTHAVLAAGWASALGRCRPSTGRAGQRCEETACERERDMTYQTRLLDRSRPYASTSCFRSPELRLRPILTVGPLRDVARHLQPCVLPLALDSAGGRCGLLLRHRRRDRLRRPDADGGKPAGL